MNENKDPNQNERIEDIPDELFAPIGNKIIEKPKKNPVENPIPQPGQPDIDISNENLSLEEESKAVKKYELGEKGYNPKRKKYIFLGVFFVFLFLIGSYLFYTSSKIVFIRGLHSEYKEFHQAIDKVTSSPFFTVSQKGLIGNEFGISFQKKIERNYKNKSIIDAFESLEKFSVTGKINTNRLQKKMDASLLVKSDVYNAIDTHFYGEDNKVAMDLKKTYAKPVYQEIKAYSNLFNEDDKTSKMVSDITKVIRGKLQEQVKEIEKKDEKISIKNTKVNLHKWTITFSKEQGDHLFDTILSDTTFQKNMNELTKVEQEIWQNKIKEIFQRDYQDISLSLYTRGFFQNTVGFEIKIAGDTPLGIQFVKLEKQIKFMVQREKDILFGYENDSSDGAIYYSSYELDFQEKSKTDNKIEYDYVLLREKKPFFDGIITTSKSVNNKKTDGLMTVEIDVKEENKVAAMVRLEFTYSNYVASRMESLEWKDAISYDKVQEEDKTKIKNKFFQNSQLLKLDQTIRDISRMQITDRMTTRYTNSCIDVINQLLKVAKEKDPSFKMEGTYEMNEEGLLKDGKVVFMLDKEKMLSYPDTVSIVNKIAIKENQVWAAKLKFQNYYVTYDTRNQENPIFISQNKFK